MGGLEMSYNYKWLADTDIEGWFSMSCWAGIYCMHMEFDVNLLINWF